MRGDSNVPNEYEGDASAAERQFAIVVSRYNESITSSLLNGAIQTLVNHGVSDGSIDVAWVPGAWEIPVAALRLAGSGRYAAVLTLGAVIRGETSARSAYQPAGQREPGSDRPGDRCSCRFRRIDL